MFSKIRFYTIAFQIFVLQFAVSLSPLDAGVILDQSYDAIVDQQSFNDGVALTSTQSLSQTFTVGVSGLLNQIDVQIATTAPFPSTGLVLDILAVSSGVPTVNSLGNVNIPLAGIPARLSSNHGDFVSVDVSGLGILVDPGDVIAFELTHPTATGAFTWFNGGVTGYLAGAAYFRNPPNTTYGTINPNRDLGFRTFVETDPVVPEPTSVGFWAFSLTMIVMSRRRRQR